MAEFILERITPRNGESFGVGGGFHGAAARVPVTFSLLLQRLDELSLGLQHGILDPHVVVRELELLAHAVNLRDGRQ